LVLTVAPEKVVSQVDALRSAVSQAARGVLFEGYKQEVLIDFGTMFAPARSLSDGELRPQKIWAIAANKILSQMGYEGCEAYTYYGLESDPFSFRRREVIRLYIRPRRRKS
jgi:hypothetical protein